MDIDLSHISHLDTANICMQGAIIMLCIISLIDNGYNKWVLTVIIQSLVMIIYSCYEILPS